MRPLLHQITEGVPPKAWATSPYTYHAEGVPPGAWATSPDEVNFNRKKIEVPGYYETYVADSPLKYSIH